MSRSVRRSDQVHTDQAQTVRVQTGPVDNGRVEASERERTAGQAAPSQRGILRVYLGASPGVGKTFAMLDEGQRRAARGTDVVVGLIETHGRVKTADQIGDLEVVPRRWIDYLGTSHSELDLPALLFRKPEVALVDELAHTNISGTENEKRWQDIEQLLAAGMAVTATTAAALPGLHRRAD